MNGSNYFGVDANRVLKFQHKRVITALFIVFLEIMEDLQKEHENAVDTLLKEIPEEYHKSVIHLADYFDKNRLQIMRKRILDKGNSALRELSDILDTMDVNLK